MQRTAQEVWEECLEIIRDAISIQSYRTWFEPLRAVALEEDDGALKLTVQLPSQFYYEWLEEHYFALLRKTIMKVLGPSGQLLYDILLELDKSSVSVDIYVDPGQASAKEIAEVFASLSELHKAVGGFGIVVRDDNEMVLVPDAAEL